MKSNFVKLSSGVILFLALTASVRAQVYIYGGISLGGGPLAVNTGSLATGTEITSFGTVHVYSTSGSYASVPFGTPVPTTSGFAFLPVLAPDPAISVWNFTSGGLTYSFDLGLVQDVDQGTELNGTEYLKISGMGTLHITGYLPTPGSYLLTANSASQTFSFSSSNGAVPEPGSLALMLLGGALVCIRRRN